MTAALMLVFFWLSANPEGGGSLPLSHAVLADTSLVLLCLILMLGAVARLVPRLRRVVPWGRELGIAMFVTAGLHVAILNGLSLGVTGFFGERMFRGFEFDTSMLAAANWVGVVALGYALVLAATSNDWSQRKLGRGWKFPQRQAYTLFVLAWHDDDTSTSETRSASRRRVYMGRDQRPRDLFLVPPGRDLNSRPGG